MNKPTLLEESIQTIWWPSTTGCANASPSSRSRWTCIVWELIKFCSWPSSFARKWPTRARCFIPGLLRHALVAEIGGRFTRWGGTLMTDAGLPTASHVDHQARFISGRIRLPDTGNRWSRGGWSFTVSRGTRRSRSWTGGRPPIGMVPSA